MSTFTFTERKNINSLTIHDLTKKDDDDDLGERKFLVINTPYAEYETIKNKCDNN